MPNTANASHITGIAIAVCAIFFFALIDASSTYITATIPVLITLWVRYLIQLGSAWFMVRRQQKTWFPKTQNWFWQVLRAFCYISSSATAYLSLRFLHLAEYTAIAMLSPVITSALAVFMLHEKMPRFRVLLLVIAFTGALLIIKPGSMEVKWALLLPLAQVAFNIAFLLITAHLSHFDESLTTHMYSGLIGLISISALMPFMWTGFPEANITMWLALIGGCFAASIGHLLLLHAYRFAPSTVLMPYLYMQIAIAVLLGWLLFGNIPNGLSLLGIVLIASSGVLGALYSLRKTHRLTTTTQLQ